MFYEYLGYKPKWLIRASGINTHQVYSSVINDNVTVSLDGGYRGKYWLKQSAIGVREIFPETFEFMFLTLNELVLRFTNDAIKPVASRSVVIETSGNLLKNALKMCVYLWMFENIASHLESKPNLKANASAQHLLKLIQLNWDNNPLLRQDVKPDGIA